MKANSHPILVKWFLIGFGIRAGLAVVVTFWMLWEWESVYLYLADPATILLFALLDFFPDWLAHAFEGSHPLYIQMNIIASFLWGGIFVLIPLVHRAVAWLMPPGRAGSLTQ